MDRPHRTLATGAAHAHGISVRQLRSRAYTRVTHGRYVAGPIKDETAWWAAVLDALPPGTVLSHASAARLYELPLVVGLNCPAEITTVTVPATAPVPARAGVIAHGRILTPDDTRYYRGVPVTTPARLLTDAANDVALEWLAAVGDAMLRLGLANEAQLLAGVEAAAGRRGVVRAREALSLLDGRSQSAPETVLRIRLGRAGLWLTPQCPVLDGDQVIAHVDLGLPRLRVGVEYEGRHHAEGEQFDRDLSRYTRFTALGWRILRAGRADLTGGSRWFIERVRDAVRAAAAERGVTDPTSAR
jgi:hypothetical protein